jgi:hypothetical protein
MLNCIIISLMLQIRLFLEKCVFISLDDYKILEIDKIMFFEIMRKLECIYLVVFCWSVEKSF